MSIHKSLRITAGAVRTRSVYSRAERMEILLKDGRLKAGAPVIGLPKTRVARIKKKGGGKKKADEKAPEAAAK